MQEIKDFFTNPDFIDMLISWGINLVVALVIFIVGKFLAGIAQNTLEKLLRARDLDDVLVDFLGNIVYALIKTPTGFYLSAVLFGLTAWSIPTIMAAAAGDFVGPRLAPAGLGFITLFFGIGQALGPALGGYLADKSGSFTLPFLVAGAISLAGMVLAFYLKKPSPE